LNRETGFPYNGSQIKVRERVMAEERETVRERETMRER
jgi:hypothetical protein